MRQLAVKDHERAVPTEQARFMMVPGRTVVSGATVEAARSQEDGELPLSE